MIENFIPLIVLPIDLHGHPRVIDEFNGRFRVAYYRAKGRIGRIGRIGSVAFLYCARDTIFILVDIRKSNPIAFGKRRFDLVQEPIIVVALING